MNIFHLPIYFQSLIESPESGPEISLAFANRSAVLYHLRKYKEAVDDIALAFRYRCENWFTSFDFKLNFANTCKYDTVR